MFPVFVPTLFLLLKKKIAYALRIPVDDIYKILSVLHPTRDSHMVGSLL